MNTSKVLSNIDLKKPCDFLIDLANKTVEDSQSYCKSDYGDQEQGPGARVERVEQVEEGRKPLGDPGRKDKLGEEDVGGVVAGHAEVQVDEQVQGEVGPTSRYLEGKRCIFSKKLSVEMR